jgi:serine/threonine protein kinase
MYCSTCRLHFAGTGSGGRCPNCGRNGASTPFDDAAAAPPAAPARVEAPRAAPEDSDARAGASPAVVEATRTEDKAAAGGSWRRGAVVAGKYEIIRRLGSGGFGTVYQVRHLQRRKLYALKVPHPEFLRDATFKKRFEREIEAMERFVHPDMVVARDSGVTEEGWPYFTMDFIEGENLRQVLAREGPLEIRRGVNIIRRILQVLDAAHRHQIIHRDIKPDNVLLTREEGREVVKVLDFGVAKLVDPGASTGSITHGTRVGTPKYMSPEQVTGDEVDARSDLFAVGILLYEVLTGRHPFAADRDPVRTTANILSKEPEPPQRVRPEIPKALAERVLQMLEKKPRRRPQSAASALELLPDEDAGRSRSLPKLEALRWRGNGPRRRLRSLVLSQETPAGTRRHFLFFQPRLRFGRSNDPAKGVLNDVILRRLPCRSPEEDPENWKLNLTISHAVATLGCDKAAVLIEPAPGVRNGLEIGGLPTAEPVRIQSDHFHLSLGDHALELDGYRALRDHSRDPLDLSFIPPLAGAADDPAAARIGYTSPECQVNCIRLTRVGNHPLHNYYLIHRRLAFGSGAGAELRIADGQGVLGHHGSLVFEKGELFLIPIAGGLRVLQPAAGAGEWSLEPGDIFPVVDGLTIHLGQVVLRVEAIREEMFKRL